MTSRMVCGVLCIGFVLLTLGGGQAATICAPGTGLKNFDFFGFLGGIIGGSTTTADDASCKACGAWEASKGGYDAKCELCVPILSAPNLLRTSCDCLPGTYVGPEPANSNSAVKNCIPCGDHAVSSTRNAASCVACPAGAIAGKSNKCECPAGYKATGVDVNGVTGCVKCDDGFVSPGGLSNKCTACSSGSVALPSNDYCGCPAGTRMDNKLAADGDELTCSACSSVFEYTPEANRLIMCKQCYPFSYATADHTGCECTGGYYAVVPSAQPVSCKRCPTGTYKAAAGNTGIESCIACPEGLEPSSSAKSCVTPLCPPGTETQPDGSCKMCSEDTFNYRRGGTCQPCKNHTASSPDRTKCDVCIHGYVQTSESGEELSCMGCMPGWTWNAATLSCDVDDMSTVEVDAHQVPDDDAYLAYIPVQNLQPAKQIAVQKKSGAREDRSSQMMGGRFGRRDDALPHDDAYMNANKANIHAANVDSAKALAEGDAQANDMFMA